MPNRSLADLKKLKLHGGLSGGMHDPATGRYINQAPLRFTHRFKNAEVDMVLNTPALTVFMGRATKRVVGTLADQAVGFAKARVEPGFGPGPHPHSGTWSWEDSGNLKEAIGWAWRDDNAKERWDLVGATIYIDAQKAPYGHWLEFGWVSANGTWHIYPFISPAVYDDVTTFGVPGLAVWSATHVGHWLYGQQDWE